MKVLLAMLNAARIEIDGQEVFVVQVPFHVERPEYMAEVGQNIVKVFAGQVVVLASSQPPHGIIADGLNQTFEEKLRTRTTQGLQWTKVPMYRPGEGWEHNRGGLA